MDGTLTTAHIDFADMRKRTRIPQGDLFTVLESSTPEHIYVAMKEILEIEAEASKKVSAKEGLMELLTFLRDQKCPVALVTRNTPSSTQAFFDLIGPEWSKLFSPVVTREYRYVKPDPRLLYHVASQWGLSPSRLLMVGDSFEDVEVGNAAGYASCLIAGGGNEKPGVVVQTPAGALATFKVDGLLELKKMLESGSGLQYGWFERKLEGQVLGEAGRPAPGLDFLDWCESQGSIAKGGASFPRMGQYAGGLATSENRGSKVLHLACGTGGLTKMMCSQGIQALGADVDVDAAERRGLMVVKINANAGSEPGSIEIGQGSLESARNKGPFDAVMIQAPGSNGSAHVSKWWSEQSLREILSVLSPSGVICGEVVVNGGINPASIFNSLHRGGCLVASWSMPSHSNDKVLRIIARRID
jgi:HAD superfamily hydrolase (TIGR01549 family)